MTERFSMDERIRLAELVGWRECPKSLLPRGKQQLWFAPDGQEFETLPDPGRDANADYAVLEKLREYYDPERWGEDLSAAEMSRDLEYGRLREYKIGDWSRAALTVIGKQE